MSYVIIPLMLGKMKNNKSLVTYFIDFEKDI